MSKNNYLDEQAKKHRTYNATGSNICPVIVNYNESKKEHKCQHTEIVKKYLFNSHYFVCKDCKEEVNV